MEKTFEGLMRRRRRILTACCLINLCIGSIYGWSVFAGPLAEKLSALSGGDQVTAAGLSAVFTLANSVGPVTMITGGFVNDRLGPRRVVMAGGLLFGAGFFFCGLADSVPALMLSYGLGCGLGMGMVYGCTVSSAVKFFPDHRGLVGGAATASYGLSSVILPPAAGAMIARFGISRTCIGLGILFAVVIVTGGLFMEKCPAGFTAGRAAPDGDAAGRAAPGRTWRQMIKDGRFYVMMFMLVCGAFSGLMVTSQAAMMAQERVGMTAGMAALAVSVLALFNTMGRVAAGVLSDFMGRLGVLRTVFALELAGLLVLTAAGRGETAFFLAGLSVMGLCFGALMGIYPGFTADRFGAEHNSVNYGIMFIGFALAGFFGPMTAGRILDISDSYNGAFAAAAALAAVGFLASLLPQRLPKKLWHRGGKCDEMSIISQ